MFLVAWLTGDTNVYAGDYSDLVLFVVLLFVKTFNIPFWRINDMIFYSVLWPIYSAISIVIDFLVTISHSSVIPQPLHYCIPILVTIMLYGIGGEQWLIIPNDYWYWRGGNPIIV